MCEMYVRSVTHLKELSRLCWDPVVRPRLEVKVKYFSWLAITVVRVPAASKLPQEDLPDFVIVVRLFFDSLCLVLAVSLRLVQIRPIPAQNKICISF